MPGKHALLSASSAARWLACPPSATLCAEYPDESSPYAAEGTFAHAVAECVLKHWLHPEQGGDRMRELMCDPLWSEALYEDVQVYTDYVKSRFADARRRDPGAVIGIERKVRFDHYVPDGYGTADAVIIGSGVMEVLDLKFGRGVRVDASGNPQIRLYALGALWEYDLLYDIDAVHMTIVQPRVPDGITSDVRSVEALETWGEQYVRPRAELASQGAGELQAGDHCRFCKHRHHCRARAEMAREIIREDFALRTTLTPDEMGRALTEAEPYLAWIRDLQDTALHDVLQGKAVPGWKAVEGRSTRKYGDPDKIAQALEQAGCTGIYEPRTLLGLTALEKVVGRKRFAELAGEYIVKTPGKPTLVPDSDPRAPIMEDSKTAFGREDNV